jgi:hypothetical protein
VLESLLGLLVGLLVVESLLASLTGPTEVGLVVSAAVVAVVGSSVAAVGPTELAVALEVSVRASLVALPASPQAAMESAERERRESSGEGRRASDVMPGSYHVCPGGPRARVRAYVGG